jgi:hypothetical protein
MRPFLVAVLLTSAALALTLSALSPVQAGGAPAAPTNLEAIVVEDALSILLRWEDNADNELSYVVERSTTGSGGPWAVVATLPANSVDHGDGGLSDGVTYWYRVGAANDAGTSYSNVDFGTASALPMPPTPPTAEPQSPATLPETGSGSGGTGTLGWLTIGTLAGLFLVTALGAHVLRRRSHVADRSGGL